MARLPRYIPPGRLIEVCNRTLFSRFLLKPSPEVNDIILGVIGRAQDLYGIAIVYFKIMANHMHFLMIPDDAKQLADFMRHLQSNLAKELGYRWGWRGKFWARRFVASVIHDDEITQAMRLRYQIENGPKDDLVMRPIQWPGADALPAILTDKTLQGTWVDRTAYCKAKRRDPKVRLSDFEIVYEIELTRLPCWSHLEPNEYRCQVRHLVKDIEHRTVERHRQNGTKPLGADQVVKMSPFDEPKNSKKSLEPMPIVIAHSKELRDKMMSVLDEFLGAYRFASKAFREGQKNVTFPLFSFPPRYPFVAPGTLFAPD